MGTCGTCGTHLLRVQLNSISCIQKCCVNITKSIFRIVHDIVFHLTNFLRPIFYKLVTKPPHPLKVFLNLNVGAYI